MDGCNKNRCTRHAVVQTHLSMIISKKNYSPILLFYLVCTNSLSLFESMLIALFSLMKESFVSLFSRALHDCLFAKTNLLYNARLLVRIFADDTPSSCKLNK